MSFGLGVFLRASLVVNPQPEDPSSLILLSGSVRLSYGASWVDINIERGGSSGRVATAVVFHTLYYRGEAAVAALPQVHRGS